MLKRRWTDIVDFVINVAVLVASVAVVAYAVFTWWRGE